MSQRLVDKKTTAKARSSAAKANGPIKVIHFADLHLGMENYGKTDPASGLNQRVLDFLDALSALVEFALADGVELVVFAGDAYKNKNPNQTLTSKFAEQIRRLTKGGVQVLLLVGNHDRPNVEKHAHSMAVFDALEVEGVIVAKDCRVYQVKTASGQVQLATLPHFSRSYFFSLPHFEDKRLDELNALMAKKIENWVDKLAREVASSPGIPAILVAHLSVSEAKLGAEQKINIGTELVVEPKVLARPEFDYVALGHLHRHQVLSYPDRSTGSAIQTYDKNTGRKTAGKNPPLVYSGSIERVDFSEEKEEKGFYLLELKQREAVYRFVPLPARRMVTIEVSCGQRSPTIKALEKIASSDLNDKIVRLRLNIPARSKELLRMDEIKKSLEAAYFVSSIEIEAEGEEKRLRQPGLTGEDSPLKALEQYLVAQVSLKPRSKELLAYGKKLLDELQKEEQAL